MGLPLLSYPPNGASESGSSPPCDCCHHSICEESRRLAWCRHWFRIAWCFVDEVDLNAVCSALYSMLSVYTYHYRCERSVGFSRCRVAIWLNVDPCGGGVSQRWVSERLLSLGEFGSDFRFLFEESSALPMSCCALSLSDMSRNDVPWTEYGESCNFCCSALFFDSLRRVYAEANVDECLYQCQQGALLLSRQLTVKGEIYVAGLVG
ncbi:hypothetical protein V8C42DRAFT_338264 [Trichoderma barbatum]